MADTLAPSDMTAGTSFTPSAWSGRPRPPLTGNTQADADIVAFYEAREQLLARQAKK